MENEKELKHLLDIEGLKEPKRSVVITALKDAKDQREDDFRREEININRSAAEAASRAAAAAESANRIARIAMIIAAMAAGMEISDKWDKIKAIASYLAGSIG